jgi:hypothetical protein
MILQRAAEADVRVVDGRAWVIAVGPVDAARATAVAAMVDELSGRADLRRVSVDLTCAVPVNLVAAATLELIHVGARPRVDVARAGVLGRLLRLQGAA